MGIVVDKSSKHIVSFCVQLNVEWETGDDAYASYNLCVCASYISWYVLLDDAYANVKWM